MNRRAGMIFTAVVGSVGLLCVLLATILGWAVIPNIIDKRIEDEVTLKNGSDTFEKWQNVPYPVLFQIYVWHVKNPDIDFTTDMKPELELRGPYIYRETRTKENLRFFPEDDEIEYQQRIVYEFDPVLSAPLSNITTDLHIVNTPFISATMGIYRMAPFLAPDLVQKVLVEREGEKFVRKNVSVAEMMFNGFPLLPEYETIIGLLPTRPDEFDGNRFAYYNTRNGKLEHEVYRVKAGTDNSMDFGRVVEWDKKLILDWWQKPEWLENVTESQNAYCNMINGTTGEVYRPFIKKDTILRIFQTEICRSLFVVFDKEMEHDDIPGYQFTMPDEFYEWPMYNPDNWCFCNSPPQFSDDYPVNRDCSRGVIRLGPCKYNSPVVTSNPAFLNANPDYLKFVTGVQPDLDNPDNHRTVISVEPNSGSLLKVSKKLQINIEMQSLKGVDYFQNVPHFLWPAFYVDEAVEMDEYWTDDLKSKLLKPLKLVKILKWTVLGIGCLLIGVATAVFIVSIRKSKSYV